MKHVPPDKFKELVRVGSEYGEFSGFGITAMNYLKWYNHIVLSKENGKTSQPASMREMRQWILDGAFAVHIPSLSQPDEYTVIDNPFQVLPIPLRGMLFPKKTRIKLPLLDFKWEVFEVEES